MKSHGRLFNAGLSILGLLLATGCGKGEKGGPPADQTYRTRGMVEELPAPPSNEIMIHHEPIPDFINAAGEKVGMNSMVMPFAVGRGVDTSGLKVGDPVEFTFEIRWKSEP